MGNNQSKTTAVPAGKTLTMPFGPVEFLRPAQYYVNRDRRNAAVITGVNAFQARLPVITLLGSMTVTLTCYLNVQPSGDPEPNISWPRAIAADDTFKARAIGHVVEQAKKWPGYFKAVSDADRELIAAQSGKSAPTVEKPGKLTYSRPTNDDAGHEQDEHENAALSEAEPAKPAETV